MARFLVFLCTIAALIGALFSAGCGGGGGDSTPPTASRIQVTVNWSERSRNVAAPTSALSAAITLPGAQAGGGDLRFTVNRNSNTAAHSETYQSPVDGLTGNRRLDVAFFAETSGTGSTVATASATVRIADDGRVLDTLTNVQKRVASVQVAGGQHVGVGESKFLSFTARDGDNAILALSPGSASFQVSAGTSLLTLVGIVAQGVNAGTAQVIAMVDGIASNPETVAVTAPLKIALVGNGQSETIQTLVRLLQAKGISPTRYDSVPTPQILQGFDVLMIQHSGNIGVADAAKVEAFLGIGRGVVLLTLAPVALANGNTNLDVGPTSIASISSWFGGAKYVSEYGADLKVRTVPGLFNLPPSLAPGGVVYQRGSDAMLMIPNADLTSPYADRVAINDDRNVYAFAYELPSDRGSGRVYYQWHPYGANTANTANTPRVLDLLIAGSTWAAKK